MVVLYDMSMTLLHDGYLPLMMAVKSKITKESQDLLPDDQLHFFKLANFLMSVHRIVQMEQVQQHRKDATSSKSDAGTALWCRVPAPGAPLFYCPCFFGPCAAYVDFSPVAATMDVWCYRTVVKCCDQWAEAKNWTGLSAAVGMLRELMAVRVRPLSVSSHSYPTAAHAPCVCCWLLVVDVVAGSACTRC